MKGLPSFIFYCFFYTHFFYCFFLFQLSRLIFDGICVWCSNWTVPRSVFWQWFMIHVLHFLFLTVCLHTLFSLYRLELAIQRTTHNVIGANKVYWTHRPENKLHSSSYYGNKKKIFFFRLNAKKNVKNPKKNVCSCPLVFSNIFAIFVEKSSKHYWYILKLNNWKSFNERSTWLYKSCWKAFFMNLSFRIIYLIYFATLGRTLVEWNLLLNVAW